MAHGEIINTYDQLTLAKGVGLPIVAIGRSYLPGRQSYFYGWSVWSPYKKLDPNSAWYEYGRLVFRGKVEGLEQAKAWGIEHGGVIKWKRNSMGEYIDARVAKQFPLRKKPKDRNDPPRPQ